MKIGVSVSFNWTLRARRIARGYRTQQELAQAAGLPLRFVRQVEGLARIKATIQTIAEGLRRIAAVLETDFDELFPSDYLEHLEQANLPEGHPSFTWRREISLSELPPSANVLQLPSAEDTFLETQASVELSASLAALLGALPQDERQVLVLRYGLGANQAGMTRAETARALGLTPGRVRGAELAALGRLRNSARAQSLR